MRKIKKYKLFLESRDHSYLNEKLNGVTIHPEDAEFSMVFEFGDVDAELIKDDETYDVKFLVVQPSDGSICDDLWYVAIDSEDEESLENCRKVGIQLKDNRIDNEEITEFILECYRQGSEERRGIGTRNGEDSEEFGDFEINVTNIFPSHIIESGYVMTTCSKDDESLNINFDVIQPSNSDWFVAIDGRDLEQLKKLGLNIETKEIEFTGGYVYNCIQGDDFNFILDWYDTICNDKRDDWR